MQYKSKCIYPDCLPECNKYRPLCNEGINTPRPKNELFKGVLWGCFFIMLIIGLFIAIVLYTTKPV